MPEPEEQQNTEAERSPTTGGNTSEPFLKGKHRGQEVSFSTREEALAYAQKGLDYEKRMGEHKREKEKWENELKEYREFKQTLTSNEDRRRVMEIAYSHPDPKEALRRLERAAARDADDDDDPSEGTSATSSEIAQLRSELEGFKRERASEQQARQREGLEKKLYKLARGHKVLSGDSEGQKAAQEAAVENALVLMSKDPDLSVDTAILTAAERIRKIRVAEAKGELDEAREREGLRTAKPSEGTPNTAKPERKKATAEDLRRGGTVSRIKKDPVAQKFMDAILGRNR